jgi:hypothetical protein
MSGSLRTRYINARLVLCLVSFAGGLFAGQAGWPFAWAFGFALALLGLLRWPRAVGLLLTLLFCLGALFTSSLKPAAAPALQRVVTETFVSSAEEAQLWSGLETLKVRNAIGDIDVSGGAALHLEARYRYRRGGEVPKALLSAFEAGVLSFTGVEPAWLQARQRELEARLRARVPRRVALELSGRRGDVSAQRLASVRIETNLGDIRVREIAGPVVASTDVGEIVVTEAEGGIEVNTKVGDLWLEPLSARAPVLAQTDTGDITLILPQATDARVIASSLSGDLPPDMTRRSATEAEQTFGRGTQLIVLKTRIGSVRVVRH